MTVKIIHIQNLLRKILPQSEFDLEPPNYPGTFTLLYTCIIIINITICLGVEQAKASAANSREIPGLNPD